MSGEAETSPEVGVVQCRHARSENINKIGKIGMYCSIVLEK